MPELLPPGLGPLVAGHDQILLLLDFDGTLSDIAPRPEDVALRPGNAAILHQLARLPIFSVGVVSGRSLADVEQRVGVAGLIYAGNHGLEIRAPGLDYCHPNADAATTAIAQAARSLRHSTAVYPGALVEDKTFTLTLHYRQTPPQYHDAIAADFQRTTRPLIDAGTCRVTTAKMALELRPAIPWDKGRALLLIRSRVTPSAFPIYIGDDATDEDAYLAAQSVGGIGVFVGPANSDTRADWRVASPAAVTDCLSLLLGACQRS